MAESMYPCGINGRVAGSQLHSADAALVIYTVAGYDLFPLWNNTQCGSTRFLHLCCCSVGFMWEFLLGVYTSLMSRPVVHSYLRMHHRFPSAERAAFLQKLSTRQSRVSTALSRLYCALELLSESLLLASAALAKPARVHCINVCHE